jgi:transposase
MRQLRPILRNNNDREPEVRFETDPGHQTQVDWAHLGDQRLGEGMAPLFGLVAILGASRVPAIRAREVPGSRLARIRADTST